MGDRANVFVKEDDGGGVYLYTHWQGSELSVILADALRRKLRWDDSQYLSRIIFCKMIDGNTEGETGFGITYKAWDGDDRIIEVDVNAQTVSMNGHSLSFDEYCNTPNEVLLINWNGG